MNVYRLNDMEWWMANSLEGAIVTAMLQTGCSREDVFTEDGSTEALTDEQLDKYKYTDAETPDKTTKSGYKEISFREWRDSLVRAGEGPGIFACTEW